MRFSIGAQSQNNSAKEGSMRIRKPKVRTAARIRMGWAALGTGFFSLLVLALVVFAFQPGPSAQIKSLPTAPRITSFKINNGAASTTTKTVTLNNTVEGQVSDYRVSSRLEDLNSAPWKPHSNAPSFDLNTSYLSPDMLADLTKVFHCQVYYQVRLRTFRKELVSSQSLVSLQVADGIDFILPPREYKVYAGDALLYAGNEGYTSFGQAADTNSDCALQPHAGSTLILQTFGKPIPLIGGTFGAKAEFVLFSGRNLHSRWKFKKI